MCIVPYVIIKLKFNYCIMLMMTSVHEENGNGLLSRSQRNPPMGSGQIGRNHCSSTGYRDDSTELGSMGQCRLPLHNCRERKTTHAWVKCYHSNSNGIKSKGSIVPGQMTKVLKFFWLLCLHFSNILLRLQGHIEGLPSAWLTGMSRHRWSTSTFLS